MTQLDTLKAQRARAIMAERYLTTPDYIDTPPPSLISFPAYITTSSARFRQDGSLGVTFIVPIQFARELYPKLIEVAGQTLAVSAETIELPDA